MVIFYFLWTLYFLYYFIFIFKNFILDFNLGYYVQSTYYSNANTGHITNSISSQYMLRTWQQFDKEWFMLFIYSYLFFYLKCGDQGGKTYLSHERNTPQKLAHLKLFITEWWTGRKSECFCSDSIQMLKCRKPVRERYFKGATHHRWGGPWMTRLKSYLRKKCSTKWVNLVKAHMTLFCLLLWFPWLYLHLNTIINVYLKPWGIKKMNFWLVPIKASPGFCK